MIEWFSITAEQVMGVMLSVLFMYVAIILIIKINGLRSFSKFSSHDFAITIAIGSILATTVVSETTSVAQGALAIGFFLFLQTIISYLRRKSVGGVFDNCPILLMDGPNILHDNMKKARVTESDLVSKLREANVLNREEIKAVVLEATGDISVLHGEKDLEEYLLDGVRN